MNDSNKIPDIAFDWYDDYAHGAMDRRTFLSNMSTLAATGISVAAVSSALMPDYAKAEQVSFNDPAIKATYQTFKSPTGHGEGKGYLVMPTSDKTTFPVVLVIHENRGLNPYIKDVARRLAKAGFLAFAPDALYPLGGYPGNDDEGRTMQRSLDRAKIEADFTSAAKWLKHHDRSNRKLGAVGFCFGGYIVNMLAATIPESLNAGVPFYGTPAKEELRENVKGPLMVQLGELDERVNKSWPDYEAVLKANKAEYIMHMYSDARHGFHNDSTSRYKPDAAELAWDRTVAFFQKHLSM